MIKITTQEQLLKKLDKAFAQGVKLGYQMGRLQAVNEKWAEFHGKTEIPQAIIKAFENDSLDNFETGCR